MLISYRHRFIFIHVYKTAGSSITAALKDHAHPRPRSSLPQQIYRLWEQRIRGKGERERDLTHITARELREMLSPPVYDRFFSFAFVRNPWDWQVSLYFYMLKTRDHFQHRLIHSMQGFEEYIRWRVREDRHLQKDFVTDEAGNLLVDFVGKYENLEQDFAQVCARIGIQAALPHLNQSGHRNYREYYNERTRNLVYDAFKEDIEFFHYTF